MAPTLLQIALLGLVQGAAELLPVSSSAHVIVAEKLMGLDPSAPALTFLLVMLHTGTMFAVIAYFWNSWRESYFASPGRLGATAVNILAATLVTVGVGRGLQWLIEKVFLHGTGAVEDLFSRLPLIAAALAVAGFLIVLAALKTKESVRGNDVGFIEAGWIGAMQGLCLPFRGLSRSGATISAGMLLGIGKRRAEEFSFALAVVITPPVIVVELRRLLKAQGAPGAPLHFGPQFTSQIAPGLLGMGCSFVAGLLALRLLSRWLEGGRWHYFGIYCFAAAVGVETLALLGY